MTCYQRPGPGTGGLPVGAKSNSVRLRCPCTTSVVTLVKVEQEGTDSPKIPPTSNKVESSPAFLTSGDLLG